MKFLIILLMTFCLNTFAQVVPQGNPVGTVLPFLGSTAPVGYLKADGSCVRQTTYAKLYSVIGNTNGICGAGLFKLPDFEGVDSKSYDIS